MNRVLESRSASPSSNGQYARASNYASPRMRELYNARAMTRVAATSSHLNAIRDALGLRCARGRARMVDDDKRHPILRERPEPRDQVTDPLLRKYALRTTQAMDDHEISTNLSVLGFVPAKRAT